MKIVNLIKHDIEPTNVRTVLFPDGQPHVYLKNIGEGDEVAVIVRLDRANDVLYLLMVANALDNLRAKKSLLQISYLMGARYDRSMVRGDSVGLKVIAKLINSCEFAKVEIFDVHSDVALQLIDNSVNISNQMLVEEYQQENAVLISPDGGAAKKIEKYCEWNRNIVDTIQCIKERELSTGVLKLEVLKPEKAEGRNCVIVDDLCDGGATFLAIASQIRPKHLTLIVSHGVFSKGNKKLLEKFDEIITTDSYQYQNAEKGFRVVRLFQDLTDAHRATY